MVALLVCGVDDRLSVGLSAGLPILITEVLQIVFWYLLPYQAAHFEPIVP
jgi:hypothetical protein